MSDTKVFIGIDPGVNGGLCRISSKGVAAIPIPESIEDIVKWLRECLSIGTCYATLEKVQGFIGNPISDKGVNRQPSSALFKLGNSYGVLQGILTTLEIKYDTVAPQQWMKVLGINNRGLGLSYSQRKTKLKDVAKSLYPNTKITLKTADSILLATYSAAKNS